MAIEFAVPLDLTRNEVQNAIFQRLASDPATPPEALYYWNNGTKKLRVYNGTEWQNFATEAYVDAVAQGLDVHPSVRAATTANIALTGTQTIDGVSVVADDRVLVKDQADATENGIYIAKADAWLRATDADSSADLTPGSFVFVEEGTANADSGWVMTADAPFTLDTDDCTWAQFSGAGQITAGAGLTKTGNQLDVGAGVGIISDADEIRIDTALVVRKYLETIGDGAATSFNIDHNLGVTGAQVEVYRVSDGRTIYTNVTRPTSNRVVVSTTLAPSNNELRVVVHA